MAGTVTDAISHWPLEQFVCESDLEHTADFSVGSTNKLHSTKSSWKPDTYLARKESSTFTGPWKSTNMFTKAHN
jgi:hypothetical protein